MPPYPNQMVEPPFIQTIRITYLEGMLLKEPRSYHLIAIGIGLKGAIYRDTKILRLCIGEGCQMGIELF